MILSLSSTLMLYLPLIVSTIDLNKVMSYSFPSKLIFLDSFEFIIDFIFVQPQNAKAKVRSRLLLSPLHAKRLSEALKENIMKYEMKFGQVKNPTTSHEKSEFYN